MTAPLNRPSVDALREEVLQGLRSRPKTLPPKLFYDAAGAQLFEQITTLPEYYLTRAELEILERHAGEIAQAVGPGCALIEYGSGAGIKVRLLLDALDRPLAYVPIDISTEQLASVARTMRRDYPSLAVLPVAADYTASFALPALPEGARRVAFFPGSTIGNFHPTEATAFLRRIRRTIGAQGALILGVDRIKDPRVIEAAYDDAAGVTAAFNRNMLARVNRDFDGHFPVDRFTHRAAFNREAARIEMHLVSMDARSVFVAGESVPFESGESIWTESSYKYDEPRLAALASGAGLRIAGRWTDVAERFWVVMLEPAQ
jgi:dimethylhistidine N-methyltransferase